MTLRKWLGSQKKERKRIMLKLAFLNMHKEEIPLNLWDYACFFKPIIYGVKSKSKVVNVCR